MQVHIEGLEAHIEQVVEEKVRAALAGHSDADRWLNSDEAAEYLGVTRSTLHDYVSADALPRHGGRKTRILLRRSELDRFIASRGKR